MNYTIMRSDDELQHWGVPGMKWGVRRYQNKDGSLTPAGRKRYDGDTKEVADARKQIADSKQKIRDARHTIRDARSEKRAAEKIANLPERRAKMKRMMKTTAKVAIAGATVAGGAYAVDRYLSKNDVKVNGKPVFAPSELAKLAYLGVLFMLE